MGSRSGREAAPLLGNRIGLIDSLMPLKLILFSIKEEMGQPELRRFVHRLRRGIC